MSLGRLGDLEPAFCGRLKFSGRRPVQIFLAGHIGQNINRIGHSRIANLIQAIKQDEKQQPIAPEKEAEATAIACFNIFSQSQHQSEACHHPRSFVFLR